MAACEAPLRRLVTILSEDGLQQPPPLAGFWLTSSTQQGIVLDRIEDPLAKGLGLAGRSQVRGSPGMGAQQSMFLKEVFTDILPRLGGRSSVSRAEVERLRKKTLRRYTYCGVVTLVVLFMLFASSISKISELERIDALVRQAVPEAMDRSSENVETAIKIQNGRLAALVLLSERVAHIGASIQGLFSCVKDAADGRLLKSDEYELAVKAARERHADFYDRKGGISGKVEGRILELLRAAIWYEQIRPSVRRVERDLSSLSDIGRVIQVDGKGGTLKGKQLEIYLLAVKLRNDAYLVNAWPGQITAALKNSGGVGPDPHDNPSEEWDHSELAAALFEVQRRALPPESVDVLTSTARAYRVTLMNLLLSRIPPIEESVRNRYKVDPRAIAKVERALGTVKPETIVYGSLLNIKPENLRQTRAFIQPPVQGIYRSFTQAGCYDFFDDLNDEVTRPTNQSLHGRKPGDDRKVVGKVKALYRAEYKRRWEAWVDDVRYGGLNDFREALDDLEGLYIAQSGGLKDLLSYLGRGPLVPEEERPVFAQDVAGAEGEKDGDPPPLLPPIDVVSVCASFARSWNDAHQLVDETGSLKDELLKVVGDMTELHSRISGVSASPSDVARNEAALELMSETLRGQGPLWPAHSSSRTMRLSIDNPRVSGIVRSVNGGMVQDIWRLTVRSGTAAVQNDWNVVRDSWSRIKDRYPFNPSSNLDANVDDVRALLGTEGELKRFIDTSMIPLLTDRGGGNYRTPDAPLESGTVPRFDSNASRLIQKIRKINSVVDSLDDRYRVVITPNKYACKTPGACNDITSMHLDLEGRREIEDYFGQRSPRDFEVARDSIVTVSSWTGSGARSPCTSRTFEGDWAFWRMMAGPAQRQGAAGGREVDLYFGNNEANTNCSIPVRPGFRYREDRNRGPAASFDTLQFKLPEKLFRY
jgi:type VI protein secretion system component VasK